MVLLFFFWTGISQSTAEITGSYSMSSGSPEGGTSLIVLPDHTFVQVYFGGIQKGTWEVVAEQYTFTYHEEPRLVLYARKNPTIKDSVTVRMAIDEHNGLAFRFNGGTKTAFTPVFNENANCFDYPYIYSHNGTLLQVDALINDSRGYDQGELKQPQDIYNFDMLRDYNEFMVAGLPSAYSKGGSFTATLENNILHINGSKSVRKGQEYKDINKEDLLYIENHVASEILPKLLEYGNEFFPYYESPTEADLIPFTRIKAKISVTKEFEILQDTSLFVARCQK